MSLEFSCNSRYKNLKSSQGRLYDLCVIGGGISGVATALDAASRGWSVLLLEQGDFAQSTSSSSSKLIHGGLRYLEQLEFKLVFESLSERAFLLQNLPDLVKPLKFFIPVYQSDPRPYWMYRTGLWLYDLLSLFRAPGFHKGHSKDELVRLFPGIEGKELKGGLSYFDASMWDDAMTVLEAKTAHQWGASVFNYTKVTQIRSLENEHHLLVEDVLLKQKMPVPFRAKKIALCLAPYTDSFRKKHIEGFHEEKTFLKPSQGAHFVFSKEKIPVDHALLLPNPDDGRVVFVLPRKDFGEGCVIVGTTDVNPPDLPENLKVLEVERKYIFKVLKKFFPGLSLSESDVLSTYVGMRPLLHPNIHTKPDAGSQQSGLQNSLQTTLQKISREHWIEENPRGVFTMVGGKYTTHRKMGEECVNLILDHWEQDDLLRHQKTVPNRLASRTEEGFLQMKHDLIACEASRESTHGISKDTEAMDWRGFKNIPELLKKSLYQESVQHLDDFYFRRLPLGLFGDIRKEKPGIYKKMLQVWDDFRGFYPEAQLLEAVQEDRRFDQLMKRRQEGYSSVTTGTGLE